MIEEILQTVVTVLCTVIASGGFWTYLQSRKDKNSAQSKMLVGLGHDRIMYLGMKYIERSYITRDEYENLYMYLYEPYKALGGNGSAEKVMQEVNKLPISNNC